MVAQPPSATAVIAAIRNFLRIGLSLLARTVRGRALIVFFIPDPVLQLAPPCQPLRDVLLEPEWSRFVEDGSPKSVREVLLRDVCLGDAMSVLVPLSIAQF